MFLGGLVVGAVLLVSLQGNVPHVVYWIWKVIYFYLLNSKFKLSQVPASEHDGPVADYDQHDRWGHLLRPHPRPRHLHHTEPGLLQEAVQGEGGGVD